MRKARMSSGRGGVKVANFVGRGKNQQFLPPTIGMAKNALKAQTQNNGKRAELEKRSKQISDNRQSDDCFHCPFCGSLMTWWRGALFCPRCGWREGCCD